MIIQKFSKDRITTYPACEGNVDQRHRTKDDPFKFVDIGLGTFKARKLRKIGIDVLGRVTDQGPHKD